MAYEISKNRCTLCGRCVPICPVGAIYKVVDGSVNIEGFGDVSDYRYKINAKRCISCDTCVDLCPMKAIHEALTQEYD